MYVHVAKLIRYQELHIMDEFLAVRFKTLHCEWLVRSFAFWLVHLNIYYSNHKNPMHHLIDNYVTYVSLCMFCVLLYDAMQRNRPFWGHSFRTTLGRFSVLLFIFMYLMIYLVNDAHICTRTRNSCWCFITKHQPNDSRLKIVNKDAYLWWSQSLMKHYFEELLLATALNEKDRMTYLPRNTYCTAEQALGVGSGCS